MTETDASLEWTAKGAVDEVLFLAPTWSLHLVRATFQTVESFFAARQVLKRFAIYPNDERADCRKERQCTDY